ncbi:MAG: hypothetical protein LBK47_02415 [Prevotellaceae bacterium]|jgi:hypothetical protein|nr:hypothetical protein [Prevotellaceae bacterium]
MKVKIEEEKHEIDLNKSISWQIRNSKFYRELGAALQEVKDMVDGKKSEKTLAQFLNEV